MDQKINEKGLDLIKYFEGLRLKAYKDAIGKLTIGFGHTGPDVTPGLVIDQQKANELLSKDVKWAETAVNHAVKVPINTNQFSALVCFTYNVGSGNLNQSGLLKDINEGKFEEAADGFGKWIYAKGKSLSGLVARREKEKELFTTPV